MNRVTVWHSFWDPRVLLNPLRPIIQKYYGGVMVRYIRKELQKRFEEIKAERFSPETKKRARSIITLAVEAYVDDNKEKAQLETLDGSFADLVTTHIRLFLFAGNDTTSSTAVFAMHLMPKHPKVATKLRQEHDEIFGKDVTKAANILREQPASMNQCRYTLAVIKETLRLYSPAANMRLGSPEVALPMLNGKLLPTQDLNVIVVHHNVHLNPRVWVRADEFLPERWLVEPGHELYPPIGAYRPFDIGPRTCIGQQLALMELRLILILTARRFSIQPAYEEWDQIQTMKAGVLSRLWSKLMLDPKDTVHGDRVYQTEKAGTHPSHGYPCHVDLLE